MDKEIIALIATLAGSTETIIIWYFILNFMNNLIGWSGAIACCYFFGKGLGRLID